MEGIREYYDKSAESLEKKKQACKLDAEETKSILSSITEGADSLLDVGCGTAHLLDQASARMRVGIDFSIAMLRLARGRGSKIHLLLADARHIPFKEGTFQIIVCQDVIGHFRDAGRLVNEAVRVLSSKGRIIATATRTSFMSRMISIYSRVWLGVYVRSYKLGELEKIFEVSGVKPVLSEVIGNTIVKLQATR